MLMHEWIRYRKQQVKEASDETEETEAPETEAEQEVAEVSPEDEGDDVAVAEMEPPEASQPVEETATVEASAVEVEAVGEPETTEVGMGEEGKETQAAPADAESTLTDREAVLNSLQEELDRAGNSMKDRLSQLQARQRQLPIDVGDAEDDESGGGRSQKATETRQELVQRLLDPILTLREASLLIDVCPTTVRRYTNRGLLNCFRTPGNQRRFHLSDILEFLERRERGEV